jgi:hypothetical protein
MVTDLYRVVTHVERMRAASYSTPASNDPIVVAAHRLLERLEPAMCPPLDLVRVGPCDGEAACYAGLIVINPEGSYYGNGNPLLVAMLLFHEQWHSLNGADERAAREASEAFLERHRV